MCRSRPAAWQLPLSVAVRVASECSCLGTGRCAEALWDGGARYHRSSEYSIYHGRRVVDMPGGGAKICHAITDPWSHGAMGLSAPCHSRCLAPTTLLLDHAAHTCMARSSHTIAHTIMWTTRRHDARSIDVGLNSTCHRTKAWSPNMDRRLPLVSSVGR